MPIYVEEHGGIVAMASAQFRVNEDFLEKIFQKFNRSYSNDFKFEQKIKKQKRK